MVACVDWVVWVYADGNVETWLAVRPRVCGRVSVVAGGLFFVSVLMALKVAQKAAKMKGFSFCFSCFSQPSFSRG